MNKPITTGSHHIGLTVSDLEESAWFFTGMLGWNEVRRDEDYPAIFVSDGTLMVTLWKARDEQPSSFDKDKNIGLHHVAFLIESEQELEQLYKKIDEAGLKIEFSPELLRGGPAKHMMCYEPSGIRVEFIWPGQ
jgi:catechol 2,3-dioxygenase-like lactoylglutathione lyase family enzyme